MSELELNSRGEYVRALKEVLPEEAFSLQPRRLFWIPFHLMLIAAGVSLILHDTSWLKNVSWLQLELPILAQVALGMMIGHSYGCLLYLGHEILHGSVIGNRKLQTVVGGFCMLPYCISPGLWRKWHNQFHHGRTTVPGDDPDYFGDVLMIRRNRPARWIAALAPGSGYIRSWFFLGYWFSFQAMLVLFIHSIYYKYWSRSERVVQYAYFGGAMAGWLSLAVYFGPLQFLYLYAIPMVIANLVQMVYVATNHLKCDETPKINDPLVNSLSVQVPGWVDWIQLNFSYHVEHHVFPKMSPRFAPLVHDELVRLYGTRARRLPLGTALRQLYGSPAVHYGPNGLVDMRTGEVHSTLGRNGEPPRVVDHVKVPVRPPRREPKPATV